MDPIFSFLRAKPVYENELRWYWYVATDPDSSKDYGPIRISVTFDKKSLVLVTGGAMAGGTYTNDQVNQIIENDFFSRAPDLKACAGRMDNDAYFSNGILTMLGAEASGISLIAYYGIQNQMVRSSNIAGHQWLQVVGPWTVDHVKVQ